MGVAYVGSVNKLSEDTHEVIEGILESRVLENQNGKTFLVERAKTQRGKALIIY
jgi:hypothetical protein